MMGFVVACSCFWTIPRMTHDRFLHSLFVFQTISQTAHVRFLPSLFMGLLSSYRSQVWCQCMDLWYVISRVSVHYLTALLVVCQLCDDLGAFIHTLFALAMILTRCIMSWPCGRFLYHCVLFFSSLFFLCSWGLIWVSGLHFVVPFVYVGHAFLGEVNGGTCRQVTQGGACLYM